MKPNIYIELSNWRAVNFGKPLKIRTQSWMHAKIWNCFCRLLWNRAPFCTTIKINYNNINNNNLIFLSGWEWKWGFGIAYSESNHRTYSEFEVNSFSSVHFYSGLHWVWDMRFQSNEPAIFSTTIIDYKWKHFKSAAIEWSIKLEHKLWWGVQWKYCKTILDDNMASDLNQNDVEEVRDQII